MTPEPKRTVVPSVDQRGLQRAAERPVPTGRRYVAGEAVDVIDALQEVVDPAWLAGHVDGLRDQWAEERRVLTASLREQRRARPLVVRLVAALDRAQRAGVLPARAIGRQAASSSDEGPGGRRPPGSVDLELEAALAAVRVTITNLEDRLDEAEGIAPPKRTATEGTARSMDLDERLFTEFAGVKAEDVPGVAPELGSRATVYRKRAQAGLDSRGLSRETGGPPAPAEVGVCLARLEQLGHYGSDRVRRLAA